MSTEGFDASMALLLGLGYEIAWRELGWHECLLSGEEERWVGVGRSRCEALDDAIGRALPSRLARGLFEKALAREVGKSATGPVVKEIAAAAREMSQPARSGREQDAEVPRPRPEPSPAVERPTDREANPRCGASRRPASQQDSSSCAPAEELAVTDPNLAPPDLASRRSARPAPRLSAQEVREQLDDLQERISADRVDVAMWSAARQRLQLLEWVAWAKAVQDGALEAWAVEDRVRGIVRDISRLSGIWWPGNVRALQHSAIAADSTGELGGDVASLSSWEHVAIAAREHLEAEMEREEAEGADEHGWWDARALQPPLPNCDEVLQEARGMLVKRTGPLGEKPKPGNRIGVSEDPALVVLAKRIRWVRGAVVDSELWGALMGRLRFLASRGIAGRGRNELAPWLDPHTSPQRSWALELGWDPKKRARRSRRRNLFASIPAEDASEEELHSWLLAAFDCDDLGVDRIGSVMLGCADRIQAMGSAEFSSERKHRRRFVKLQKWFKDGAREVVGQLPDGAEEEVVVTAPSAESASDPMEHLLAGVLPRTRGLRVLLVSNRADPEQDTVLVETFAFDDLDHAIASPRRVDALVERIAAGRYGLVLSSTGFQSHAVDGRLKRAAEKAQVPYVRANRARRGACIRALARDLVVS